eukprot:GHVS01094611.1.p1 GENE.GHVS01094611.1~~GHVS01094611.1.p1  ORF type:complete len:237 (+),score=41.65 GHVS01094611.1:258-968(+)
MATAATDNNGTLCDKHILTYFNIKNVAEPIRLAFYIGGIDFEDVRVNCSDWGGALKDATPFGQLPVLQLPNSNDKISQSIAILTYAGTKAGLFPSDAMKALKCNEVLCTMDELKGYVGRSVHVKDAEEKKKMRVKLANETLPFYFEGLNKLAKKNGSNGHFVGDKLTVADLHVYVLVSWINSGILDDIPTNLMATTPDLAKVVKQTGMHPQVMEFNAKSRRGSTVSRNSNKSNGSA